MGEFDLIYVFRISTPIIKLVILILVGMSVASWTLIFFKFLQLSRTREGVMDDLDTFQTARGFHSAVNRIRKNPRSPSYSITHEGVTERKRLRGLERMAADRIQLVLNGIRHALHEEARNQRERLFAGIPFLATCSNAGPLLGLFGTVWGIMHSFHGFKGMTTVSLASLAPGLAEAMVTTALGLIVAIPAVLAHNILQRKVDFVENQLLRFCETFVHYVEGELMGPREQAFSAD